MNIAPHPCPDAATLAQTLAADIAQRLRAAVTERGQALLAVSGGKSPVPLFQQLSQQALPWAQVTVLLVDERCVPPDHADSNSALVRQHLLQGQAAAARWLPFFDALPCFDADTGLPALTAAANRRLQGLPWPLDVAVLGMGEDGHTASLFPGAPGFARAIATDQRLAWVVPDTAPHARISFTLSALLAARELVLSITGESKLAVYRRAAQKADEALPISLVINQTHAPLSVWMN